MWPDSEEMLPPVPGREIASSFRDSTVVNGTTTSPVYRTFSPTTDEVLQPVVSERRNATSLGLDPAVVAMFKEADKNISRICSAYSLFSPRAIQRRSSMEPFAALHVTCSEEFERGNREQDARADAAEFDVPLDILDKERYALLAAGSSTEFIS